MVLNLVRIIGRGRFALATAFIGVMMLSVGIFTLGNPLHSTAETACDNVNIIRCGISGDTTGQQIRSFQYIYNQGSDSGHQDLKTVYRWAGATDTKVANMNTSNTKAGTLYRNGEVKVDGKVVGTNAWITARFTEGAGFTQIASGVWARKTTTSFAQPSEPVLVHYNQNGDVDFVVAVHCGNAVKVTLPPKPPKPQPELSCVNLDKNVIGTTREVKFTAYATAKNTRITSYAFYFGDGNGMPQKVSSNAEKVSISHTYANWNTTYNAHVVVVSSDFPGGKTSANCAVKVTTPKKPEVPSGSVQCLTLVKQNNGLHYYFFARGDSEDTAIKSYTFDFGDGNNMIVATSEKSATAEHLYALNDTTYVANVTVQSADGKDSGQTAACTVSFTTPKVEECKPGIPVGDVRCNECKPGVPVNSPACETEECKPGVPVGSVECESKPPTPQCETDESGEQCVLAASTKKLADTGPGETVAVIAGVFGLATLGYRYALRRKFGL
jgi:hypothetical protein